VGFTPLQRLRSLEPTHPELASPGTLRLQGSLALVTRYFSCDLHGSISRRARSWGSALRSVPLPKRDRASRPDLTHMPLARNGRTLTRPTWLGSWVLLPSEVRVAVARRSQQPDRCSLGLRLSRGFFPVATVTGFPVSSSHELHRGRCETRRLLLRVSIATGPVRLRGDHRPS